ncbi:transcobalamin-2 isoform X7 [Lagenorhynchus albirostris]|uniref:transcobalamin-2 isoform X7 n=1 Tax=Lagenorhynchus albirostris TaxID=27610 RepID=UPI0028E2CCFB|nr:transcobalamin-2 isoform X7 [Lagenorhynchus albirostris]XP_060026331.1 transcobalamin-2 isoform X7 [Lagenorhynchus albirostris]
MTKDQAELQNSWLLLAVRVSQTFLICDDLDSFEESWSGGSQLSGRLRKLACLVRFGCTPHTPTPTPPPGRAGREQLTPAAAHVTVAAPCPAPCPRPEWTLSGSPSGRGTSNDNSDSEAKPSMGQLALYLLALRANCEFVRGRKGDSLVSQLKRFLEDEKGAIGHNHQGHPHTSYYQYGLGILALCVHQKRVHDSVVGKLLYAVEHKQHLQQGHLPVDTLAMAGLAFSCLKLSNLNPNLRNRSTVALGRVQEKILKAQTPEGHFGNVYSTPLALQLLMASLRPTVELGTACLKAKDALLASLQHKAFQNPLMISQLLPILNQKSYVDLISPDCEAPRAPLWKMS